MTAQTILVVDPDAAARDETIDDLSEELGDLSSTFETAGTASDARSALATDRSVVITEFGLPDETGFDLVTAAREACPDAGCILYTATDPETTDTDPLRGTITEYVGKGSVFGTERLARLVRTTAETAVQTSYPLPQNEDERLAALKSYDLDDEGLGPSLDRITTLAAEHFDVE